MIPSRQLITWFFALPLALALVNSAMASVIVKVDRSTLSLDETLTMTLRRSGSSDADDPDFSALEKEFEVLGTNRSSQISIINFNKESWVEWTISLAPRRAGKLHIPAIRVGNETSSPLTITVTEPKPRTGPGGTDVYLEVETSRESVYVQAELVVTVRLYHAVNLNRGATLSDPELADALVKKLEDRSYTKLIDGKRYGVFERRYAVFPQKSGNLLIPAMTFQATLDSGRRSWFDDPGAGRIVRARSAEKRVKVLPPVDDGVKGPWLPATGIQVVETWDKPPDELKIGDSATRTVTISGEGLLGAQLPPLEFTAPDGIKIYPEQPQLDETEIETGFRAQRTQTSAVVPIRPGRYTLPERRIPWWDTSTNQRRYAVLPARELRVSPAAQSNAQAASGPQVQPIERLSEPPPVLDSTEDKGPENPTSTLWAPLSGILALCCGFFAWQWWRLRQQLDRQHRQIQKSTDAPAERTLYRRTLEACRRNDARESARCLSAWLAEWHQRAPDASLSECVSNLGDPGLTRAVEQLQARRFSLTPGEWNGRDLASAVQRLRSAKNHENREESSALPPLYPA